MDRTVDYGSTGASSILARRTNFNNKNMEYNKNGAVDRYHNLDDILKLNLDNSVRENIEEKFGRRVFFDSNGSCKMGKLCGLEVNHKLSMLYYIIETDEKKLYVPTYQSITLV